MKISEKLQEAIHQGVHRIGEIEIRQQEDSTGFILCHWQDTEKSQLPDHGDLEIYHGPDSARDLSTYSADGDYRFTKGEISLKNGWLMLLDSIDDLRMALDHFYPAATGLYFAWRAGSLEVEHMRHKLNRQTGMYRYAGTISDAGAQQLIQQVCGPAHRCAKKILWQLDEDTPLDDSEASRYNGIPDGTAPSETIPLLCREACNHFVAECRKAAKAEFDSKQASS
ncbi:MAG: DR2241 family protein [Luteolibacter sp.]